MLGTKNLGDILSERESIAHELHELLYEATEPWGVQVERVEVNSRSPLDLELGEVVNTLNDIGEVLWTLTLKVKDVRVPEQLMRAMAAEAEAARNARAKVIGVLDDYCGIDHGFLNYRTRVRSLAMLDSLTPV